jgi:hypothetical protein
MRAVPALLHAVTLLAFLLPALGQADPIHIEVDEIVSPPGDTAVPQADLVRTALQGALVEAASKAAEDGCEIDVVTAKDQRRAIEAERELQKSPGFDPATTVKGELVQATVTVGGIVSAGTGGSLDVLAVARKSSNGESLGDAAGSLGQGQLDAGLAAMAEELVGRLCPKAFVIRGGMNDLKLDSTVCNIRIPFMLDGRGETAGIVFKMAPSGQGGGSFTITGTAGGVPWSGGGSYTQSIHAEGGSMTLDGSWSIKTPVGVFGDSGTIPLRLTRIPDC